jgi:DNA-binding LacI/PurR family transcriptional regulator
MRRDAYHLLADRLRELILDGTLPPGRSLPPLRDLCSELGFPDYGLATARRATQELAAEGLVVIFPRSGVRVIGPKEETLQLRPGGKIGVVMAEIGDSFTRRVLEGILEEVTDRPDPYMVTVAYSSGQPPMEARNIRALIEDGVQGLIILPSHPTANEDLILWANSQVPVVFCDRRTESLDFPFIRHDHSQGGYACAMHLLRDAKHGVDATDRGSVRRILVINDREASSLSERIEGVRNAFFEWSNRFPKMNWKFDVLFPSPKAPKFTNDAAIDTVHQILMDAAPWWNPKMDVEKLPAYERQRLGQSLAPYGIVYCHEKLSIPAVDYLRDIGIQIPQELLVVSFDDIVARSRQLTSMRQVPRDLGADSVKVLIDRIQGLPRDRRRETPRPVRLVVRESTGGLPERQTSQNKI